jgi:hypothetical protein
MRGMRSESTYLGQTISSRPKRPCVRPIPLALIPPCGASLMPKHVSTSFTITVQERQSFTALVVVGKNAGRQTSAYFSAY